MTIFIIEDNLWQAEQFSRQLQTSGYQTKMFNNAADAMNAIDDDVPPDVIILDVLLVGTTGMGLLHELQSYQDTSVIPIILCTGLAENLKIDQLASYGVKRIVDKLTMHPDDIITAVRSVL